MNSDLTSAPPSANNVWSERNMELLVLAPEHGAAVAIKAATAAAARNIPTSTPQLSNKPIKVRACSDALMAGAAQHKWAAAKCKQSGQMLKSHLFVALSVDDQHISWGAGRQKGNDVPVGPGPVETGEHLA